MINEFTFSRRWTESSSARFVRRPILREEGAIFTSDQNTKLVLNWSARSVTRFSTSNTSWSSTWWNTPRLRTPTVTCAGREWGWPLTSRDTWSPSTPIRRRKKWPGHFSVQPVAKVSSRLELWRNTRCFTLTPSISSALSVPKHSSSQQDWELTSRDITPTSRKLRNKRPSLLPTCSSTEPGSEKRTKYRALQWLPSPVDNLIWTLMWRSLW